MYIYIYIYVYKQGHAEPLKLLIDARCDVNANMTIASLHSSSNRCSVWGSYGYGQIPCSRWRRPLTC